MKVITSLIMYRIHHLTHFLYLHKKWIDYRLLLLGDSKLLAIPAISETSSENCVQNVKADASCCLLKWFVFFRQNEGLIEVYL
jgi:hypothetical protein